MAPSGRQPERPTDFGFVLAGRAVAPGDPDYEAVRGPALKSAGRRPELIVEAADSIDVALVVELARSSGRQLAVRVGPVEPHIATGGILLDLTKMRRARRLPRPDGLGAAPTRRPS